MSSMSVGFLVETRTVEQMYRQNSRGELVPGDVEFNSYGAPRPRVQELMIVGFSNVYEHLDTYDGKTTLKDVIDFEFEITRGRDKGVRFRQPWISKTVGERSILGQMWRATGVPVPGPGSTAQLSDLMGKPFQAMLKQRTGRNETIYTSLTKDTITPVDDDEDDPAVVALVAKKMAPPVISGTTADDPFDEADEPGFD